MQRVYKTSLSIFIKRNKTFSWPTVHKTVTTQTSSCFSSSSYSSCFSSRRPISSLRTLSPRRPWSSASQLAVHTALRLDTPSCTLRQKDCLAESPAQRPAPRPGFQSPPRPESRSRLQSTSVGDSLVDSARPAQTHTRPHAAASAETLA